jgi:nicotinamide mononucleotide adenylyltransferase
MVDNWESSQSKYMRTALVLDHFDEELNREPVQMADGSMKKIEIVRVY